MRMTLAPLALALALPSMALADDAPMTDDERSAFRAEVRAYLLDNPEVLLEAMQVLESRETAARAAADGQLVAVNADALFEGSDWVGGNPDGDLTLVEFVDYKCGYCKRARPEVDALIQADGNIRMIRKELPILGAQSMLASQFAIATRTVAGDQAYADVSDALMATRSDVTIDTDLLAQLAETYGLDSDAILAEMDSDATEQVIQEGRRLAMRLQIQGTPAFVVGQELLRGYLPLDQMELIVAEQRDKG